MDSMEKAQDETERKMWEAIDKGLSPCCGEPLDDSRLKDGKGVLFCPECRRPVCQVP